VRFAAVAQEVRERGFPVMLVEGPADGDAVRAVQESAGPLPVLRGLAVRELARQLAQGGLFVGNDSGVTHLAAWLGLPTIALFGPTDPSSWAPLGTVRVLRACTARATRQGEIRVCGAPACMAGLSVAAVLEAVLAASGDV
jgi:ADP-heptose:LPS heptosyltransferase